jgi:hypothetical protein
LDSTAQLLVHAMINTPEEVHDGSGSRRDLRVGEELRIAAIY